MKSDEWKFEKYIPDLDDIDVAMNEYRRFSEKPRIKMNESERNAFIFNAGFYRGMSWALAKMKKE